MTKNEYETHKQLHTKLESVLISCAHEISMVTNNRKLVGEFSGDLDMYPDGRYLVQFESFSCGEVDYDSVWIPVEYLYDTTYRKYYKEFLIQEKEVKRLASIECKKNKKRYRLVEITDE